MQMLCELMWQVLTEALLVLVRVLMERLGHWLTNKLEKLEDGAVVPAQPVEGGHDESP